MATPHISANRGDFAKTVLMPGDPLRAKFIAETFLTDAKLVNQVRNILAFTGFYEGKKVSVMASGMGMPSMGIYSYELFKEYDVETIIRIGSAGAYTDHLKLGDIVLADSAWSESSFAKTQNGCEEDVLYPSKEVNDRILGIARQEKINIELGRIHSSDVFYTEANVDDYIVINRKHGCLCVEMESFALFHNAKVLSKQAACLVTISDVFSTGEKATIEERQSAFTGMMKIALKASV